MLEWAQEGGRLGSSEVVVVGEEEGVVGVLPSGVGRGLGTHCVGLQCAKPQYCRQTG